MQKKIWGNFIFLRKKGDFSIVFYGHYSVTAAWPTRSPWEYCEKKLQFQTYQKYVSKLTCVRIALNFPRPIRQMDS